MADTPSIAHNPYCPSKRSFRPSPHPAQRFSCSALMSIPTKAKPRRLPSFQFRKCHSLPTTSYTPVHPEDNLRSFTAFFRPKTHPTTASIKPYYERALVSALKSCSSILAISQGQQLHSLLCKSGLLSNIFILNSLISLYTKSGAIFDAKSILDSCTVLDSISCNILLAGYVKFGYLNHARQLFVKIPHKSHVSFTTMVMGLAQGGCWFDAIELFKDMRVFGFVPNEVTMWSVILAYSQCGGFRNGHMIHALVIKVGVEGSNVVLTNMVQVYCACSCLKDARKLLAEMPDSNIVSWNIMLNGYAKGGFVDLAMNLFEKMPERDVVSWGTIVDCFVQVGKLSEALTMYRAMLCSGVCPNDVMIVDIIAACGQAMAFHEGRQYHGVSVRVGFDCYDFVQSTLIHFYAACCEVNLACLQFELGSKDHLPSWNALISGLVKNGMLDHAREIFNKMPERDVFSWSSMISGYSQTEQPRMALELFHEMVDFGIKPNEVTMVSVLSAIASLGILAEGKAAHEYIYDNLIPLNDNLSAAIIDMYAKCGSISAAFEVFNQVRNKISTVSPWNAIICGSAMHGHADLALRIFYDLEKLKIALNSITFIGVLTACCHAGLIEEGERHFKSMKSVHKVDPNIKHYGCMVDLLGRAGRLEEANDLIESMPMRADVVIWGTLLSACRTHGNLEIGEKAAESLARAEPSHGSSRILLSNIYADAGKWDDAISVRRAMQSQRLTKTPAYSGTVM